ncbi:MAG: hypothetical protein RMJ19_13040, partial [Gemmatales bacterium]|nr:hypothetical protein [Gemmatales bacterium]MDW8176594.1 hypothetical protein [Gemmatales bacterium]
GLMIAVLTSANVLGQSTIPVGSAPRLLMSGQGAAVPTIGSAPRLGNFSHSGPTVFTPVDITRNSVIPLSFVQRTAFQPHQPTFLDRLGQLLPFAAKTGAALVAPEAVIIHDSLPNVTIK